MVDKITFMETLRSVAEITKTSNEPLSREEVLSYFKNMDLSKEQQEMIYQYLLLPQEDKEPTEIKDEVEPTNIAEEVETTESMTEELSDSAYFKMYLQDIDDLQILSQSELSKLYKELSEGQEHVIQTISDHWLPKVLEIAKQYSSHDVNMEDIIQEGNTGLIIALSNAVGNKYITDITGYLEASIKESMVNFIDESINKTDWESTMIAKATLIHEAIKALSNELGHTPSIQELCNYTKLSKEEISDILDLSKEKR